MSFHLVLFVKHKPPKSAIISAKDTKKGSKNDTLLGKWGKTYYPIQIVMSSDDKDFLDSLGVKTDGSIIPPNAMGKYETAQRLKDENKIAENNVELEKQRKKKLINDDMSIYEMVQREESFDTNFTLQCEESFKSESPKEGGDQSNLNHFGETCPAKRSKIDISSQDHIRDGYRKVSVYDYFKHNRESGFDEIEEKDECELEENRDTSSKQKEKSRDREKDPKDKFEKPETGKENFMKAASGSESADQIMKKKDANEIEKGGEMDGNKTNLPLVTPDRIQFLRELIVYFDNSNPKVRHPYQKFCSTADQQVGSSDVEIGDGSGVFLPKYLVQSILINNKKPEEIVRDLYKHILRDDILHMSPSGTGKGVTSKIPEKIFYGIQSFVNEKFKRDKLNKSQYTRTVTLYCDTYKNSKEKKKGKRLDEN